MEKKVLIVDDEPNNLQLMRQILNDRYKLIFANNGEKALEAIEHHAPDIVLLDVMMPGMSGHDVCRRLKDDPTKAHIPVIFVTAMSEVEDEAVGFDLGAVDYIEKPVSRAIVRRRVETHLSLIKAKVLENSYDEAIHMLGDAGHYNDTDTGVHIWRMAAYSAALAKAIGWSDEQAKLLQMAAPMHDTGKIGIPDGILKAPRKLTTDEWSIMMGHAKMGFDILSRSHAPVFTLAAEVAHCHHEKWDGSGYPDNLRADAIPISARIVAIADVFDALTMKRPYKKPWAVEAAMQEIRAGAGKHFDPKLVARFDAILPEIVRIKNSWDAQEGK